MAERELTAGMLAALGAGTLRPVLFTEVEYVSLGAPAFLRLHTGIGEVSWNGETWTGGGQMLGITPIKESRGLEAIGFSVRISGLPADKMSIALASMRKNRSGKVWLGFYEPDYVDFDFTVGDSLTAKIGAGVAPVTFTRAGATATRVKKLAERYVSLPGIAGSYASTPDTAAVSITGDLDIRIKVAMNDWINAGAFTCFVAKWNSGTDQRSWAFELTTTGTIKIHISPTGDGLSATVPVSTVAIGFSDGTAHWVRVTVDVDNGAGGHDTRFYTSEDGVTWTQLGATVTTAGVTSFFDSTVDLNIGAFEASGNGDPLAGKVYYAEVRNGTNGTVVAKFDPSESFPDDTTITASTGEVWTLNGTARVVGAEIEVVAADTPRFDYDPLTLECKGLLIEEARTNLCLHSDDFSNAVWNLANITVTTNSAIAPDGTVTADKLAATTSAATTSAQPIVLAGTSDCVYSIFAKKGSGATDANSFNIYNVTTATDLAAVALNYDTGVLTQSLGSGATVERWHDGWYRIKIPQLTGITSGDTVQFYPGFNGGSETAGEYAYVWRAQVEPSAFASSPISATTTVAVTRERDFPQVSDISGFYNQSEGTMVCTARIGAANTGDHNNVADFRDLSADEQIRLEFLQNTGAMFGEIFAGGAQQSSPSLGAYTFGTDATLALAFKQNDFAGSANGGAVDIDTVGTMPGPVDRLHLGVAAGTLSSLNGHLRRFRYYPRRLSNADLQLLSGSAPVELAWGGLRLVADPYLLRRGRFDIPPITRDGDTMSIELRYEDRLVDLERPRERRYTREDQQLRLAGDNGFDQVPELQDAADAWGEPGPVQTIPRPVITTRGG